MHYRKNIIEILNSNTNRNSRNYSNINIQIGTDFFYYFQKYVLI